MKEKIIVFGLGKDFDRFKEEILEKFDVIACTDNLAIPTEAFWREHYIKSDLIYEYNYNKILICTRKYQDAIKLQLIKKGVLEDEIIYIDHFNKTKNKLCYKELASDMEEYMAKNMEEIFNISEDSLYLIGGDKYADAGKPNRHYFAQDIWGGNKIYKRNPVNHYDIGSRLEGFIAHLLVFREVYYIDIRPLPYHIPGLYFVQSDATRLKELDDSSIESLSCFHALEHFGLGRYGDKIEPDAYRKSARNMQRVLKNGGHLYLGVPVGPKDKLVFNAHRIFSIPTILSLFGALKLEDIAIIEPDGLEVKPINKEDYRNIKEYSCAVFEFIK